MISERCMTEDETTNHWLFVAHPDAFRSAPNWWRTKENFYKQGY